MKTIDVICNQHKDIARETYKVAKRLSKAIDDLKRYHEQPKQYKHLTVYKGGKQ